MQNTTDKYCEFCGAVIQRREIDMGTLPSVYIPVPCECVGAVAHREEEAKAERIRKQQEEEGLFYSRLEKAGIRRRYFDAEHPDTGKYANEITGGKSLYFYGKFGTGKTYLASAIAKSLVQGGWRVRFITSIDLLIELQSTYGKAEAEADVLSKYSKCDVLVIDDLGKEPPTEWALSRLYAIINNRDADMLPIIITSNYKTSELVSRMAGCDESTAEALASRLAGMCEAVEIKGADRRLA